MLNQDDYPELILNLKGDIIVLESRLRATGKDVPPKPDTSGPDYILNAELLQDHVAKLRSLYEAPKASSQPVKPETKSSTSQPVTSLTPLTDKFNSLKGKPAEAVVFYRANRAGIISERGNALRAEAEAKYRAYAARIKF